MIPQGAGAYRVAPVAVVAAASLTGALWRWLAGSPSLFFFPAVILTTVVGGLGPGLLATVLSVGTLAFFFLPPYLSFVVGVVDLIRLIIFSVTTVMLASVVAGRRRAELAYRELTTTLEDRVAARTAELDQTRKALDGARRLETIGRLAAGVAHDFNNLLTVIIGNAELLERHLPAGEARELLNDVHSASARAAALTRQLLAYGRQQPLRRDSVPPEIVVQEVEPLLRRLLPATITLHVDAPTTALTIAVDRSQFDQVLTNLAINAVDAMPDGGVLTMAVKILHRDGRCPPWSLELEPGAYACFCVEDTGIGMDQATLARAFDPFLRPNPSDAGPG